MHWIQTKDDENKRRQEATMKNSVQIVQLAVSSHMLFMFSCVVSAFDMPKKGKWWREVSHSHTFNFISRKSRIDFSLAKKNYYQKKEALDIHIRIFGVPPTHRCIIFNQFIIDFRLDLRFFSNIRGFIIMYILGKKVKNSQFYSMRI